MVTIGSHGSWQPGRGPVTTWTASPASREIMARAEQDALPPSFQQEQHLRTAFRAKAEGRTVPRLIMASWDVDGWCDVAAMTDAINGHLRRHDTYHSAFEVTAESITRRTITDSDSIEFVPTVLGFMEQDQIRTHTLTATPGTLEWDCFTFGVIQKADHFTVYANIDHLHSDGTSATVIYRDIHQTYQALVVGQSEELPPTAGYRDFTARQRMQVEARRWTLGRSRIGWTSRATPTATGPVFLWNSATPPPTAQAVSSPLSCSTLTSPRRSILPAALPAPGSAVARWPAQHWPSTI
jgi:hypothetical protein